MKVKTSGRAASPRLGVFISRLTMTRTSSPALFPTPRNDPDASPRVPVTLLPRLSVLTSQEIRRLADHFHVSDHGVLQFLGRHECFSAGPNKTDRKSTRLNSSHRCI